jgi:hypothetical protein
VAVVLAEQVSGQVVFRKREGEGVVVAHKGDCVPNISGAGCLT